MSPLPPLALLSVLAGFLPAAHAFHELASRRSSLEVTPRAPPKADSLSQALSLVDIGLARPQVTTDQLEVPMQLLAELHKASKQESDESQESRAPRVRFHDMHLQVTGLLGTGSYASVLEAHLGSSARLCALAVRVAFSDEKADLEAEAKAVGLFREPPFIATYFNDLYVSGPEGGVESPKYSTVAVMEKVDESLQDLSDRTFGILEHTLAPIRYGWSRGPKSAQDKRIWDRWAADGDQDKRVLILATRKLQLFIDVVDALRIMAQHQMLHRDVKPANVGVLGDCMLEACRARLFDFGFACSLSVETEHDEHCSRITGGSPRYMDRDVYAGRGYSNGSDVWSAGVLLYYLFFGRIRKPLREAREISDVQDVIISDNTFVMSGGTKFRSMQNNRFYKGWATLLERIEAPERISIDDLHELSVQELQNTKDKIRMTFQGIKFDRSYDSGPGFGNKAQCDLAFDELKRRPRGAKEKERLL